MDQAAWICATRYSRKTMVTIASDRVEFKKPVGTTMADTVNLEWYVKFSDRFSQLDALELVKAADYLKIEKLLELACAKIALFIKSKGAEWIVGDDDDNHK